MAAVGVGTAPDGIGRVRGSGDGSGRVRYRAEMGVGLGVAVGLALGRATICWIDDRVEEALLKASGASTQPFHSVYVGWLEDYLIDMIEEGPEYIINEGIKAKK